MNEIRTAKMDKTAFSVARLDEQGDEDAKFCTVDVDKKYRFVTAEQVALLSWVPLPAFIVPQGMAEAKQGEAQGPWEFVTTEGNIPAPQAGMADEIERQRINLGLGWCFTPKAKWASICVFQPPDRDGGATQALATFEQWLVAHDYPFDRLDNDATNGS